MSDLLVTLLGMNMVAAAAVAAVMALRLPVRRLFGAQVAYGLWAAVPLAALAILLPGRVIVVAAPAAARLAGAPPQLAPPLAQPAPLPALPGLDPWMAGGLVWIAGGAASLAWLAWRQHQFSRAVRAGRAGPAVAGVLKPRIVTPDDFAGLYTPREQLVVLAHERTHIARHDARANAAVALARCVNWFNPAVHVAAHYLRIDQELACDAQVVAAHPQARRSYAEAMLKTQLAARPLPLGCYWPAQSAHPLADRIRLLAHGDPGRARRRIGAAVVALLALSAVGSAWAAKPARVVLAAAPAPAHPAAVAPSPAPAPAVRRVAAAKPKIHSAKAAELAPAPAPVPEPPAPAPEPVAVAQPTAAPWGRYRARTAAVMRPLIAPGTAVRVVATTLDPDGVPLANDITSYSANPLYRSGSYRRAGSRYGLYTSVFQHGERYWITASITHSRQPVVAGSISLKSGETGDITLANGQVVTVTPTARPETPDEAATAESARWDAVTAAGARAIAYRRPPPPAPIF